MLPELYHADSVLITQHAVARRFRENEGDAFHELLENNRSRIEDLFAHAELALNGKEECEAFIRKKFAAWLLQREYAFGVWHNVSAKAIGFVQLFNIDWKVPKAEVIFFIDRDYEAQGLMTEVLTEVMRFAFSQLRMERITLHTASDNFPAQRLARKCGFRREGDLRAYHRKASGELIDVMLLAATK
jgi:RimJ/RimL family protein N-acetyltransferase